jgi:hypothetical protein
MPKLRVSNFCSGIKELADTRPFSSATGEIISEQFEKIGSLGHEQFARSHSMKPAAVVHGALADYQLGEMTLREIARKYRVSKESLINWAQKAALPPRRRGTPKRNQPTPRQKQILELIRIYEYEAVGRRFGVAKQEICRIAKRWGTLRKDEVNRTGHHNRPELRGSFSEGSSSHFGRSPSRASVSVPSSYRPRWGR